jgi:hypothetical protein
MKPENDMNVKMSTQKINEVIAYLLQLK